MNWRLNRRNQKDWFIHRYRLNSVDWKLKFVEQIERDLYDQNRSLIELMIMRKRLNRHNHIGIIRIYTVRIRSLGKDSIECLYRTHYVVSNISSITMQKISISRTNLYQSMWIWTCTRSISFYIWCWWELLSNIGEYWKVISSFWKRI
jgi:hypothetical protein